MLHPSDIRKIKSVNKRRKAFEEEVRAKNIQDSLRARIDCDLPLDEREIESGVALLGKGCRSDTKIDLLWRLLRRPGLPHGDLVRAQCASWEGTMNKKAFPVPVRNIEWTKIRTMAVAAKNSPSECTWPEVEERKNIFIYYRGGLPDAVVFWSSLDADKAQAFLHKIAFARCCEPNCGIRVKQLGMSCGNHRPPKR